MSEDSSYPAPTLKEDDVAEPPNSRKGEKISSIRPKRERDSLVFSLSQEKDKSSSLGPRLALDISLRSSNSRLAESKHRVESLLPS